MLLVVGRLAARCGDVVAIASTISGRCVRTSLSLSADRIGRSSERLAMVCMVKTSDGAEGEARNGRRDRRHPSPWFSLFLVGRFPCPTSPPEGRERGRGRKDGRPSRGCPGSLSFSSSVPLLFPSLLAFVLSLYIIRYRYNKDNATN